MPTIEICAVGQCEPIAFSSEDFALEAERTLQSHRSLFENDLAALDGCIYHLGNKECETRGFFFGGRLLSENHLEDSSILEFRPNVKPSVSALMSALYNATDTEYLLFLTDYQFGPENIARQSFPSLQAFWQAHDAKELRLNALYSIGKNG